MTQIRRREGPWIALILFLTVAAVYAQVRRFEFVNYDDPDYVTENAHVRGGLTVGGVTWAFTSPYAANWIPLAWVSHMADVSLFGMDAGRHHLINVLLHAISTLLLFAALRRMSGAPWRSAFVAFLFALHPLHVQSVAWVAERKDVLSALFWMLALWCYARYVERPNAARYGLVMAAYSTALLAKPMAVTFPFVLILLDIWPLRRFTSLGKSLREKAPLLALAAAVSAVTFLAQRGGGAVISMETMPLGLRVANAFVSYVVYLAQIVWPAHLAVFYPYPTAISVSQWAGAALLIVGISVVAWRARRWPYLATGWFWYLGTLVPVIGLVQVGEQARADRYTYLPLIGVAILAVWAVGDLMRSWPRTLAGIAALAAVAYTAATWREIGYWKDSETLMTRAIEVTADNYVAHDNLGEVLRRKHRTGDALAHFREAVRIRPQSLEARNNLGDVLIAQDKVQEGVEQVQEALQLNPNFPQAHANLGTALGKLGRTADAISEYRKAVELRPDNAASLTDLGSALVAAGHPEEGMRHLREAIGLRPEYADAHHSLGVALAEQRNIDGAAAEFAEAERLDPNDAQTHYNLGTTFGAQGRFQEAIEQFRAALRLRPDFPNAELNLGKALAYLGRYEEAIQHVEASLRLDPSLPDAREALEALQEARR